ncbi:hypothetical protein GJAV_G00193700 [Gymnothorax javanicus]|nr:hypothetical protein GJAV_G00193700 [Gymnothorax javanicus]
MLYDLHMILALYVMLLWSHECKTTEKIPCQAHREPGLLYRKISWYKVEEGMTGLVLKNLNSSKMFLFKWANHSYDIGEDLSLILPNSALNECGTYHCTLWPPLGHKIQEGEYTYYHSGCPESPEAHLTNAVHSRLSSSGTGGRMKHGGVAAGIAGALLLAVFSVGIWKCKSRKHENRTLTTVVQAVRQALEITLRHCLPFCNYSLSQLLEEVGHHPGTMRCGICTNVGELFCDNQVAVVGQLDACISNFGLAGDSQ